MRVLFVEDDAMNRRVVRDMLSVAGVEMTEAEDAQAGLTLVDNQVFDLILMDLRMPGIDGLTAIRQIRARGDDAARTPIIVVTADTGSDIQAQCLAAGANDFLRKPVAMTLLFDTMGRVLARNDPAAALLA